QLAYYASTGTAVSGSALLTATTGGIAINGLNGVALADGGADVTSIAVGPAALSLALTTTQNNTAVGASALGAVTTGRNNTAVGVNGGAAVTIGAAVTAVGKDAGKLVTGSNNTLLGALVASTTLTTGARNILIGTDATTDTALVGTTSAIGIGTGVRVGSGE